MSFKEKTILKCGKNFVCVKSLHAGEQIRKTFAINCRFGKGTLYISNFGIMIESSGGALLDLDHGSILSFQPVEKKSVKIIWNEGNEAHDFVFSCERPADLTSEYKESCQDHLRLLKSIGIEPAPQKITIQNPVIEPNTAYV